MTLEELEARLKALEARQAADDDIEQIKKLQMAYGYYLDNSMWDDMIALFSDNTESLEVSDSGVFLGKEGAARFFKQALAKAEGNELTTGNLNIHTQLQGYVDLDPSGKTAKGRWQCIMIKCKPYKGEMTPILGHGVYENEYVKENGKWKFKVFRFYLNFDSPLAEGWVKAPVVRGVGGGSPDKPTTVFKPYPEHYRVPFHYKNPVTGK